MQRVALVMVALVHFPLGCPRADVLAAVSEPVSFFLSACRTRTSTTSRGANAPSLVGRFRVETACAL